MNEKFNNCWESSYQWNSWYHNIFILIVAILLICGMAYFPYELAIRSNIGRIDLSSMGLTIGFTLSMFGFIGLIFWLRMRYIANKYLYSINDIFPQNSVCEDATLINEQEGVIVSV